MSIKQPRLHTDWIDSHAMRIVDTLQKSGFETYLVGGCVRDLLVGVQPKDYDIATNAHPPQVRRKIPNAYLIGRRFQLILVRRGDHQFEVATFRREMTAADMQADTEIVGDNFFGTAEEDARRRDFTINGLFYDPIKEQLHDFVNGMADIEGRFLRMIGKPLIRLIEDPIRILRAVRLSHKLRFTIEPELRAAIRETAVELKKSVLPRRREEYLKIMKLPDPFAAFLELHDLGILKEVLPLLDRVISQPEMRDEFMLIMNNFLEVQSEFKTPTELLSVLILATARALFIEDTAAGKDINFLILEDHPEFSAFLRDDVGAFKAEVSAAFSALQNFLGLKRIEIFQRKGERRRSAFLLSDSFILSLRLANLIDLLSFQERLFWLNALNETKNKDIKN